MKSGRIRILHAVTDPISTILMRGQLDYLKAEGFEPALLSGPGKDLELIGAREGYPVYSVEMQRTISPWKDLKSLLEIWRVIRRVRPTVCNGGTPKAGLLVGIAAMLARVPCRIYTLRGLRLETTKGWTRGILFCVERLSCACAHRVVCVSPSLRERAIALGLVSAEKAVLLGSGSSNGVDTERFKPDAAKKQEAAELRATLGIRAEQPVIGFAGRLTRDKGLPELVTAFDLIQKQVPGTVLLLIGSYEAADLPDESIRKNIQFNEGIRTIGFVAGMEMYYQAMDIFVLPTHREGFPNAVLEAQASGLPVITTDATGARDSVEDGVTGVLVSVGDAEKLAEAVLALLADPEKMQKLGVAGRGRCIRSFQNEMVWEALSKLYREMLSEQGYSLAAGNVEVVPCEKMH